MAYDISCAIRSCAPVSSFPQSVETLSCTTKAARPVGLPLPFMIVRIVFLTFSSTPINKKHVSRRPEIQQKQYKGLMAA